MPNLKLNLLKMKLTFLSLLFGVVQLYATQVFSQSRMINLDVKNSTVEQVLLELEQQSHFYFIYNRNDIDVNRKVSFSVKDKTIVEVLDKVFSDQGVIHKFQDRHIVLTKEAANAQQVPVKVTGRVTDEQGESLPGVTVMVKGTTNGTITDFDGNYTIRNNFV